MPLGMLPSTAGRLPPSLFLQHVHSSRRLVIPRTTSRHSSYDYSDGTLGLELPPFIRNLGREAVEPAGTSAEVVNTGSMDGDDTGDEEPGQGKAQAYNKTTFEVRGDAWASCEHQSGTASRKVRMAPVLRCCDWTSPARFDRSTLDVGTC